MKIFSENMVILKKLNKIAARKPFERENDYNNVLYRRKLGASMDNLGRKKMEELMQQSYPKINVVDQEDGA